MNLVTLDFETYFDADYTLSKMTSEAYVRDPRFKAHCVGIQGLKHLLPEMVVLDHTSILQPSQIVKDCSRLRTAGIICHHTHFDGLILSHHYGVKPAFWFDTLSMARLVLPHLKSHSLSSLAQHFGLPEKTIPYNLFKGVRDLPPELYKQVADGCAHDVELTYQIFKKLLSRVSPEELKIIDLTIRMFTEPALRLDRELMTAYQVADVKNKEQLMAQLQIGKADLMSNERFAELLREVGEDPPTKISPRTGKEAYAFAKTDTGFKTLLESENAIVASLAECRLAVKTTIVETRAQRFLDMDARGPMPVYLKYYGAHTGRWSGGDGVNWQNLKRNSDMRLSILAPQGYVLVVGDLAQIECRMLNWLAGQEDVLNAFKAKRDLYSEGASRFYARSITKADKLERHLGKTLELGCGYGMGAEKFKITCAQGALGGPAIALSDDQAKRAIKSYRQSHQQVVNLWKTADGMLNALMAPDTGAFWGWGPMQVMRGRINYPNGGYSDYSHLGHDGRDYYTETRTGKHKIYGAKLVENVVQALSRVVLSQAMLRIAERYKIVLTTHDEVVALAPRVEGMEALNFVLEQLQVTPAWAQGLPLAAEGGYDVRYSK